jgi:hypothetical protein
MKVSGKTAKHTKSSFHDVEAISILKRILSSHQQVKPDIKEGDTWPNHDGHLEIVNGEGYPLGEITVQVKTLNPKNIGKKISYSFNDDKFLSYCNDPPTNNPILFIGIDRNTDTGYWMEMNPDVVKRLKNKTLYLDKKSVITKDNQGYYDYWKKICELRREAVKRGLKHTKTVSGASSPATLRRISPSLLWRSQKKLQGLFISKALMQKYYFAFMDLLEPFYLDKRGDKQRKRLRVLFGISEDQEMEFIKKMSSLSWIKQVGELCVIIDAIKAQKLQAEIIDKGHLTLDEILRLFA